MSYPCSRCGGEGRLPAYSNVLAGVCFKCSGTGQQQAKPTTSTVWAVLGHDPAGGQVHCYNVRAKTASSAVSIARVTWQKASEAFRVRHDLDEAFAVPAEEYWKGRQG